MFTLTEINKRLKHSKARLNQVERTAAVTDYCWRWKKQTIKEIKAELKELRDVKESLQT